MSEILVEYTDLSNQELSRNVKRDYSFLLSDTRIRNLTSLKSNDSRYELLAFDLRYSTTGNPKDRRIKWPERILFRYLADQNKAPILFSGRNDFPRDLPHLNPYGESLPASFCLWRSGTEELYKHAGIFGLLDGLCHWLKDAELQQLQSLNDGWEPTPRSGLVALRMPLDQLQSTVEDAQANGLKILAGKCEGLITNDVTADRFGFLSGIKFEVFVENPKVASLRPSYEKLSMMPSFYNWKKVPVYLLCPSRGEVYNKHDASDLTTETGVDKYCENLCLAEEWASVKSRIVLAAFNKKEGYSLVLIACKRPFRLIEEIPNVADGEAGSIEVVAVLVRMLDSITYQVCSINFAPNNHLLATISDCSSDKEEITIVGSGAIGSVISDNLARRGAERLHVVDDDNFQPHNVARHILGDSSSQLSKVISTVELIQKNTGNYKHQSYHSKFEKLESELKSDLLSKDLFIDCSATNLIHSIDITEFQTERAFRCYIADQGKLGIIQSCNPKSLKCDFFDMETFFLFDSCNTDELPSWLANSAASEIVVGLGCSSTTLKMPLNIIQMHCSAFLSFINNQKQIEEGLIGMNLLTEEAYPKEFKLLNIPIFKRVEVEDMGEQWIVSISEDVRDKIFEASKHTQNETGGYLLGDLDFSNKRICIVESSTVEQAKASRLSLELPPLSEDVVAFPMIVSSRGAIKCMGTWHSHPGSSAPSSIDKNTLGLVKEQSSDIPMPFVMYIQGREKEDISINLGLPNVWK